VDLCTNFLYIGGKPLVLLLSKFTEICVPIYLFISGYGLFTSFQNGKGQKSWKRLLPLWLNYFIIFAIFVPIGSYVFPEAYPGSVKQLVLTLLTYDYNYNGEWWFLFPYFVLVLISNPLFKLLNNSNIWTFFILLTAVYYAASLVEVFNRMYLYTHQFAYKPVLILKCLYPFGIGAIFAKENIFEAFAKFGHKWLFLLAIPLLIVARILIPVDKFTVYIAVAFIVCFAVLKRGRLFDTVLGFLGRHSTNIWLLHTFFCYYLFKNFIYSFKYPLLIFLVLMTVSIISSYIVDLIYIPINKGLNKILNRQ
jgi:hypothetical protein